ncbi:MAG: hypothetical protein KBE16_00630 [Alphaproteobacteria bacterium]|nr:hypothetical protein [Alphaproteobacteria bacterium]MBP9876926.1 hypothetical protein [Alphaproteobacteria bacterium]
MFNVIFSGLKTGSIRRLPYLGYSLLFTLFLIVCGTILVVPFVIYQENMGMGWFLVFFIPLLLAFVGLSLYVAFVLGVKRLRNMGSDRPYLWSVICLILGMLLPLPVAFIALCCIPEGWLLTFNTEEAKKAETDLITKNT